MLCENTNPLSATPASNPTASPVDPTSGTNLKAYLPLPAPLHAMLRPLPSGACTVVATAPQPASLPPPGPPGNSSRARHQSTIPKAKNWPHHSRAKPASGTPRVVTRMKCTRPAVANEARVMVPCTLCRDAGSPVALLTRSPLRAVSSLLPHGVAGPAQPSGPPKAASSERASLPPHLPARAVLPVSPPAGPHGSAPSTKPLYGRASLFCPPRMKAS